MKKCLLQVLSNPMPGRDDEYNRWYSDVHFADVLKVPGFISAQRYTLADPDADVAWRYLALYEFESDDPLQTFELLKACAGGPEMALSDAMNMTDYTVTPWLAITDRRLTRG